MKTIRIFFITALIAFSIATILSGCKWFKHDSDSSQTPAKFKIEWCYGGFNGSGALEDPSAQIGNLKISGNAMSYSWTKGNLRGWGLDDDQPDAVACMFFKSGDVYKGGKFEWISYSHKTRQFENISGHDAGWDPNKFFAAKDYAFCICSKDRKNRTNFIFFTKGNKPVEIDLDFPAELVEADSADAEE